MADNRDNSENSPADEGSEYLQIFLDETEEQLDDLVETLLVLEEDPESRDDLNEAFRLIHSIKGAAGMMGFDNITVLTHQLENRFERFRAGQQQIDAPIMNVVLRCIDFLRECNRRLRNGEALSTASELLEELRELEQADAETATGAAARQPDDSSTAERQDDEQAVPLDASALPGLSHLGHRVQLRVVFEPNLKLADLKARLILSRLSGFGEIVATQPSGEVLDRLDSLEEFQVFLDTERSVDEVREAANVDGVQSLVVSQLSAAEEIAETDLEQPPLDAEAEQPEPAADTEQLDAPQPSPPAEEVSETPGPPTLAEATGTEEVTDKDTPAAPAAAAPEPSKAADKGKANISETMRVDIDRLDRLMNLAGELVVNRAHFVQIARQVSPALRKPSIANRSRDFCESLQRTIDDLRQIKDLQGEWSAQIKDLESGLELMREQVELWDHSRHCFLQMDDAIDQLTLVSDGLRRGVLGTRMVPIGPLFNRFKRVVRDLSMERNKRIDFQIRGEKTELDKRMIDQLGDPLVHLVRNSIDHGIEPLDVRRERGKPETGSILLEARHSGNNVFIDIHDDGGGLNVAKIRGRIVERGLLSEAAAAELSDKEAMNFIWKPGFSTASQVTDVSGRGVGMDVVQTRIAGLNGTVEIRSTEGEGTTFTIRLPLTLAIVNSLLTRIDDVVFSMPIDDVREIVAVHPEQIVTVHGKQAFDVRDQFIPLVRISDLFDWTLLSDQPAGGGRTDTGSDPLDVVILQSGGKYLGLRVDELMGGQDIVIKSLADNFMHIRGLSGASVLGDGTVCLMLDVGALLDLASRDKPST